MCMKTKDHKTKCQSKKSTFPFNWHMFLQEIAGFGNGVISGANATTPPYGHPS